MTAPQWELVGLAGRDGGFLIPEEVRNGIIGHVRRGSAIWSWVVNRGDGYVGAVLSGEPFDEGRFGRGIYQTNAA